MKKSNKKFLSSSIISLVFMLGLGGSAIASAAGYWTVSHEQVGAHGAWSSFGSANVKQTNSNYASFNGDALQAAFGYNVRLINGNGASRSNWVGLYKDRTTYAGNNSGKIGYYYYADVRSQAWEPNITYIKTHFSADRK